MTRQLKRVWLPVKVEHASEDKARVEMVDLPEDCCQVVSVELADWDQLEVFYVTY